MLNDIGIGNLISAATVGYKDILKTLGKHDLQFLRDIGIGAVGNCRRCVVCDSKESAGSSWVSEIIKAESQITIGKQNVSVTAGNGLHLGFGSHCAHRQEQQQHHCQ